MRRAKSVVVEVLGRRHKRRSGKEIAGQRSGLDLETRC